MNYNFDEIIERRGTGCVKWDEKPPTLPTLNPERSTKEILPLWVADMDFAVAPAIQKAVKRRAEHPIFGYTHVQEDYYAAVINWFRSRHLWHIKREWMLYTTGVVPAITVTLKALTTPGENVLILSPDYNCFYSSIHNSGCQVAESVLRLDPDQQERFSVDWQDLETLCADEKTTVFLLCNPHNPTGRVWTEEELQQMADICHRHHVSIVSDEIHCELIMPGHTFIPMGTVDDTAVILNSPSKAFNIAGLQMANIICKDADTRRRINRYINIHEVCDVNPFAPEAVKAAYNESGEWLDAMNSYVWENYKALVLFCNEHMPHWHVMPMEGTYLVWVDVSACCDSVATYCEQLIDKAKVWLNPGTMYGPISGEGYIRINIACPRSLLMEALERIRKLTKK
ncbi:MAG: pyridoxal phosphate-dependent aminotransferase [Prevotella sp.]|nr:pyridoxal phosphate-dependent aminotransferase [Prevotella sp.]